MNTQTFPLNTQVINFNTLGQVIGYKEDSLILEGVGEAYEVGKWLADPAKCQQVSKGHLGFNGVFEYFMVDDNMYRALRTNPISADGIYRQGARFECPLRLVHTRLKMLGM